MQKLIVRKSIGFIKVKKRGSPYILAINQSVRVKFKTFKCTHDELVSFTAKFEGRRIEASETISSSISHHDMQLSITGHILVGYRLLKLLFAIT